MASHRLTRRTFIRAGAIGAGLGLPQLLAAQRTSAAAQAPPAKAVIYIFLSGGLSQLDSFDMKPHAPDTVRSEFATIRTRSPGIEICEHLPMLAERSEDWSLVRSMHHPHPEHSAGHMAMLSGHTALPQGFDPNQPRRQDWPSIAAVAGAMLAARGRLPASICLPERLIHNSGRVIPGQFAGLMGPEREPLFIDYCRFNAKSYGAYPEYAFHHERGAETLTSFDFSPSSLSLPVEMTAERFQSRVDLLSSINVRQRELEAVAESLPFDEHRRQAVSLLADSQTRQAFSISRVEERWLDRYGRNTFGWSLLIARQLVEAGVCLVQVNLGNDETWDTHQNATINLKNFLFPPTDRAVSALLDDLRERGLLESTLVVMAGEMGRTPKISTLPGAKHPGRDHWGTQTVWMAGGGVKGGRVVGSTDRIGGYPDSSPQTPESLAATIYHSLGLSRDSTWYDAQRRPHLVYDAEPIHELL